MPDEARMTPFSKGPEKIDKEGEESEPKPELSFEPGELVPWAASPFPEAELSEEAEQALIDLCQLVGNKDVAARRWEVEQSWEARLFDRGYHYLLPRKGGGWILPPFATDYSRTSSKRSALKWYGYETNIYTPYGEIITAALTRDIPRVRFEPQDPESDSDITAADAASKYARIFARNNDLLDFQHQLAYYLRNDGRAVIVTDYVIDAQRFGRQEEESEPAPVPETQGQTQQAIIYLVRHGETALNVEGKLRGRSEVPLDESGEREIHRAAHWLKDKSIRQIVSSPVERSLDSAQIISQQTGAPVDIDDRLASLDIGDLAGQDKEGGRQEIEEAFETDEQLPGGEKPSEFEKRVQDALFGYIQGGNFPLAIVTHDSVISAIFRLLHGEEIPDSGLIDHGAVAAIEPQDDGTFKLSRVFPFQVAAPSSGEHRGVPRGQEVCECFGKLEAKVPINTQVISDMTFIQVSREYDITYIKAKFPKKADKIKTGGASAGENELDRIARINAALALEASYVTGDSMVRDCTLQRTWFRPSFFMEVKSQEIREELFQAFPDGCLVVMAGDEFMFGRNESMDDHCTVVHAFPGSGQNRIALLSKVLSLQKRLNNWMDLLNDFFIRTVPQRYLNSRVFDIQAINDQTNRPGAYVPYDGDAVPPGQGANDQIFVESTPTHQPALPDFIKLFTTDFPQLMSGALPSLFGAEANTDTATGIAIQRDSALGRMGTPWHNIQMAYCSVFRQAVQLAARCRTGESRLRSTDKDGGIIQVALADLKGNVLCFPENDANFPESWNQKQARYQQMLMDAATNPFVAMVLAKPSNYRLARDMGGFPEFKVPEADAYEKQLGEFEFLLTTPPVPNPAKAQAMAQLSQMAARAQQVQSLGMAVPDQDMMMLQQAQAQAAAMPDFISSIAIDKETDLHEVEWQACQDWINAPEGRKHKNGSQQEKTGFENIRLHGLEHKAAIAPPQPQTKQPSVSTNFKDLPPDAASDWLQKLGLQATGPDVVQDREFQAEVKKSSKIGGPELQLKES